MFLQKESMKTLCWYFRSAFCLKVKTSKCVTVVLIKVIFCFYFPDDGKVVKAVSVTKDNWDTEEIILEELTVFQVRDH